MSESPETIEQDSTTATQQKDSINEINSKGSNVPIESGKHDKKDSKVENDTSAGGNGSTRESIEKSATKWGIHEDLRHLQEEDIVLAATLVIDAKEGRNFTFKTDPTYVRSYNLYHKFYLRYLLYFMILFNLALALFERPAKPGWEIPPWASMILELVCLSFFIYRFTHCAYFSQRSVFWRDTKNILILVVIVLTFIDMLCFLIWDNVKTSSRPIRWSRPLRPLFLINFPDGKQIRRAFRNIRRTVPEIMNVLILFLLSVLLFGLLALKLFSRRDLVYANGKPYFKNYLDSIWDLYVLVTTANSPDVMMPAYDSSNWFAVFFIMYIVICWLIFMSIVLAAIYYSYRKNLKNEIKAAVYGKRKKLGQAFDILKVQNGDRLVVTYTVWCELMKRVIPNRSRSHIDLLIRVLDIDGSNMIRKQQFLKLADLLELQLSEVKDRLTFLEQTFPNIYNSYISGLVKRVVRHKAFRYFFDFMIFVNAWFIGFDVDEADWFFLGIFMLEIVLKLYTFGPREFFKVFWNVFDFIVIGAAVIASAIEAIEDSTYEEFQLLDYLLVLRVLRLFKIFGSIKRFKVILQTIINIGPSIITYGGVIVVFYYIFAIIGMEVFQNLIHYYDYYNQTSQPFCGNAKLNGTQFYTFHYCNNNFNDLLHSLVLLVELTVVNQWHVLASGFVSVTSKVARLYFFCFHMCCVIIVLNIFIAFILEAFILEYTIQKVGKLESYVEQKIRDLGLGLGQTGPRPRQLSTANDGSELVPNEELANVDQPDSDSDTESIPDLSTEKGLRFHLKKKSRKKVEVLLQQMFEGEIDPEDEGPENETKIYVDKGPRRLTLDTVA
ncbi:two pore calcium channel protein 1-like [Saccostrea echinata]|uniref:two pore calcium channel protein 1-like n=1 Tax=Saccostrea echinata TaxID=191078 RepID=UPI002A833AD6|nr:two pore calcium channel protein 1-like [Saccostrea echinata]